MRSAPTPQALEQYRRRLRINKHQLDDELESHAQTLEEIGELTAAAERAMTDAKRVFERTCAMHVNIVKVNDPKATEVVIKASITLDRECRRDEAMYLDAKQAHAEWDSLARAWYQRGFDLKALGELFVGQYFVARDAGREPTPLPSQQRRQALREASASVDQFTRMGAQQPRTRSRPE